MKKFTAIGMGKTILINLVRGELLIESITEQCKESGIVNAVILCAIGSLRKAKIHRVISLGEISQDEYLDIDGPLELASLQGVVVSGKPHFHMVVSSVDEVFTGHLEEGTEVVYRAEIVLAELIGINIHRVKDKFGNEVYAEIE